MQIWTCPQYRDRGVKLLVLSIWHPTCRCWGNKLPKRTRPGNGKLAIFAWLSAGKDTESPQQAEPLSSPLWRFLLLFLWHTAFVISCWKAAMESPRCHSEEKWEWQWHRAKLCGAQGPAEPSGVIPGLEAAMQSRTNGWINPWRAREATGII